MFIARPPPPPPIQNIFLCLWIIFTKLASLNSKVSTPRISNVLVLCMYIYDVWPFPIEKSTNTKLCKFFNITNGCKKKHRCNFSHLNRKELKYIVSLCMVKPIYTTEYYPCRWKVHKGRRMDTQCPRQPQLLWSQHITPDASHNPSAIRTSTPCTATTIPDTPSTYATICFIPYTILHSTRNTLVHTTCSTVPTPCCTTRHTCTIPTTHCTHSKHHH